METKEIRKKIFAPDQHAENNNPHIDLIFNKGFEKGAETKQKELEISADIGLKIANEFQELKTFLRNRASGLNQSNEFSFKSFYNEVVNKLNELDPALKANPQIIICKHCWEEKCNCKKQNN